MKIKLNDEQVKFILENYENEGTKFCSEKIGVSKNTISSCARRHGLQVKKEVMLKNKSKQIININDYLEVNDPKIAYILGLIWTDGTVGYSNNKSKTPYIKHTCILHDSAVISNIFKHLNWRYFEFENNKSIGKNTMSAHWICSRPLGEYLIANNFRDKEMGTFIYKNFNKNVVSHFLRGLFDGDGCFVSSECKTGYKSFSITFSSTKHQNWSFITTIFSNLNIKYSIRECKDNLGESSQLNIVDSESINNFSKFIYNDSENMRLERKYNKYIEFINYKNNYKNYNKWLNDEYVS